MTVALLLWEAMCSVCSGEKDAWVPFGFRFMHELGSSSPFIAHLKKAVAPVPPPLSVLLPEVASPFFTGFWKCSVLCTRVAGDLAVLLLMTEGI